MRNLHVVTCPDCGEVRHLVRKLQGTRCRKCAADFIRRVPVVRPAGGWPDCVEWTGPRDRHGYGRKYIGAGKVRFAHRLAYEAAYGPIPDGLVVRHRCDLPPCVNPLHLLLGTQTDNIGDAVERARMQRGEDRPNARLTEADVLEIRRLYASGGYYLRELGDLFDVNMSTIHAVIRRRRWAWLADSEVAS